MLLQNSILLELIKTKSLLKALVLRELHARYAGSAAGLAWAYVQPILTIAAYYLVFDIVFAMRLNEGAPTKTVGTYLIVGALPWMAFGDAISRGTQSLVDASGLLQKNPLPISLFPARVVLASCSVYTPLMLILVIAYSPMHRGSWAVCGVAILWCMQIIMIFWLVHLLAILTAALRDIAQLVVFFLQIGIYLSPALFPYTQFPEGWRWVLWINPMTPALLGYQDALLQGFWPATEVWIALICWIIVFASVTKYVLRHSRDQLVDWL